MFFIISKLRKQLIQEKKLFDNALDIESKKLHLLNIHKLEIKIAQLNYNNNILDDYEDTIKAPFEYVSRPEESLFFVEDEE